MHTVLILFDLVFGADSFYDIISGNSQILSCNKNISKDQNVPYFQSNWII